MRIPLLLRLERITFRRLCTQSRLPGGARQAVAREFEDIAESGLEATLLGYIFGVGHNSNGDLAAADVASGARLSERVSGTFILDEVCAPESAVPDVVDEAVAFVSLY